MTLHDSNPLVQNKLIWIFLKPLEDLIKISSSLVVTALVLYLFQLFCDNIYDEVLRSALVLLIGVFTNIFI